MSTVNELTNAKSRLNWFSTSTVRTPAGQHNPFGNSKEALKGNAGFASQIEIQTSQPNPNTIVAINTLTLRSKII